MNQSRLNRIRVDFRRFVSTICFQQFHLVALAQSCLHTHATFGNRKSSRTTRTRGVARIATSTYHHGTPATDARAAGQDGYVAGPATERKYVAATATATAAATTAAATMAAATATAPASSIRSYVRRTTSAAATALKARAA